MVQRGYAHARDFREIFHPERIRIIRPDPAGRFCRSVAPLSQRGNRSKACSLGAARDPVDDLALNQAAEKRNVLRRVEQVNQPAANTGKWRSGLTGRHAGTAGRAP